MNSKKPPTNLQIADLLRNIAASYQIKTGQKDRFKIIAYQRAADAVEHSSTELKDLWDEGKLEELAGVGPSIAKHLSELFEKGESRHFKEVTNGIPPIVFEFMKVQGIGPKTAIKLVESLDLKTLADLEKAASEGKIAKLEGFGEESQADILTSLSEMKGREKRLLLPYAMKTADEIMVWMKQLPSVKQIDPLGSLRRKAATVGDIDLSVATDKPDEVLEHFVRYPKAQRILEKGTISAGIVVPGDIQVDLMVQPPEAYGSLLQHFTGSKHHNIALREYALKKGFSLSEKGIKIIQYSKSKSQNDNSKIKTFDTEEKFYNFLELEWIAPELREDSGEIQMALDKKIPKLVEIKNVKADLQIHSDFDIETSHDLGLSSMKNIVEKADSLGYEYLAFTEHNPSRSKHTDEQVIEILKKKKEAVGLINYSIAKDVKYRVRKVYNSLEIDILPSGELAIPVKALELLDFALVSIHSTFRLPKEHMTKRILKALSYPKVKILAHPTARKVGQRESIEADWDKIFEYCAKNNKWIEINSDPMRLDLPDFLVKEAIKKGVMLTLGTDSHHVDSMVNMQFGVWVARRGWAEVKNIVNTRSLEEFERMLE